MASDAPATETKPLRSEQQNDRVGTGNVALDAVLEKIAYAQTRLPKRTWNPTHGQVGNEATQQFQFRMLQFNILADGLSGTKKGDNPEKLFSGVSSDHLQWPHRLPYIVAEILNSNAHVVTMEELDLFNVPFGDLPTLEEILEHFGFCCHWQNKDWSPTAKLEGGTLPPDGVAVFHKKSKFRCLGNVNTAQQKFALNIIEPIMSLMQKEDPDAITSADVTEFLDRDTVRAKLFYADDNGREFVKEMKEGDASENNEPKGGGDKKDKKKKWKPFIKDQERTLEEIRAHAFLDRGEPIPKEVLVDVLKEFGTACGCGVKLESVADRRRKILVFGTHLTSAKDELGEHQRAKQIDLLIHDKQIRPWIYKNAMFMGCDLNAAPFDTKGYAPLAYRSIVGVPVEQDKSEVVGGNNEGIFLSALREGDKEVAYTTWKSRVKDGKCVEDKHCIDYIFYPKQDWQVTGKYSIPEGDQLTKNTGVQPPENNSALPCENYPSDHFAIGAVFAFTGRE